MVKNSSALQCLHCGKFIATSIFSNHLIGCINQSSNNGNLNSNSQTLNSSISSSIGNSSSLMLHQNSNNIQSNYVGITNSLNNGNNLSSNQSAGNSNQNYNNLGSTNNTFLNGVPPMFMNLDPNGLQIAINQTMVR